MSSALSLLLAGAVAVLLVPAAVLFVEVVAACRRLSTSASAGNAGTSTRLAVVIPAHNESTGVVPTIDDIKPQLKAGDRVIVVADNCSDDTADAAKSAGADVIVRNDPTQIGKGYALGWAISHISADPPDFVLFIDADCRIQSDGIARLMTACGDLDRPVQACFLMKGAKDSPIDHSFAEFTFQLRNLVRPLGLKNLNCPVQLMGTGMMFSWDIIRSAPLANGHLVEDMKLGLDLAEAGKAPVFLPSVRVSSEFPVTAKGTDSQRQRWVQGHLGMILKAVPGLLLQAIRRRNVDLLALTLDLLVPPLSLLGLLIAGSFFVALLFAVLGQGLVPLSIASLNLVMFIVAVVLAWMNFGREVLPAHRLARLGPQILKKFKIFGQLLMGRTAATWIRTDRGKPD